MVDIVFLASGFWLLPLWFLSPSSCRILHAAWMGDKDFLHSRAATELIFQPGHGAFAPALIVVEEVINRDLPAGKGRFGMRHIARMKDDWLVRCVASIREDGF